MKKPTIGIIDTKTSNIKSVYYALSLQDINIKYITSKKDISEIDGMIVPGIGNFCFVMDKLRESGLDKFILKNIEKNIPSFFICVGMQILFSRSFEFGECPGLEVFKGNVRKIEKNSKEGKKIRNIPMIGWNKVNQTKKCDIFKDIDDKSFFYFTHSYYVEPDDKKVTSSTTNYLNFTYCSSVSKKNIFATQFHPEKSGEIGLRMYKNFVKII